MKHETRQTAGPSSPIAGLRLLIPAGSRMSGNRPINLTVVGSRQGFAGYGSVGGVPLSISFLATYRGLGLLNFEGNLLPLKTELSFSGDALTLFAFGEAVRLRRDRWPEPITPGVFAGSFRSGEAAYVGKLQLLQNRNLILGTGSVYGQAFALNGIVDGPDNFRGRAIFADASEAVITGKLSEGKGTLTLSGFGGPLEFNR